MKNTKIFRIRYIPCEKVDISDDEILFMNDELIITRWEPIRPRKDFARGVSFTFLKEGYKISRFYDENEVFLYWYCDIIEGSYKADKDEYNITDLLVDIKVFPDGEVRILDLGELSEAFEEGVVSKEITIKALKILNKLLELIYNGKFPHPVCLEERYW